MKPRVAGPNLKHFHLYYQSGMPRTIRLLAWGFAKHGVLRLGSIRIGTRTNALRFKLRGEKLIRLNVAIKAAL